MIDSLTDLNWALCISALDDCIEALEEVQVRFKAALENIEEIRELE